MIIKLQMIILPFFHDNCSLSIYFFNTIGGFIRIIIIISINYYDKKMLLFSRQDNILYTTIMILYRKLYINIVSIIVLNIEAIQCNIKINLVISCSPKKISKKKSLSYKFLFFCKIHLPPTIVPSNY